MNTARRARLTADAFRCCACGHKLGEWRGEAVWLPPGYMKDRDGVHRYQKRAKANARMGRSYTARSDPPDGIVEAGRLVFMPPTDVVCGQCGERQTLTP